MKGLEAILLKIQNIVGRICEFICVIVGACMIVLVTAQVILRALDMPLFGIEELLTFFTIWLYFLGGVCASHTDAHIECGLVNAVCKNKKLVAISQCFANICCSVLAVYVLKWALQYAQYSVKMGKSSAILHIPMSVGELIIPIGLVFMAIFSVCKAIVSLIHLKDSFEEGGAA